MTKSNPFLIWVAAVVAKFWLLILVLSLLLTLLSVPLLGKIPLNSDITSLLPKNNPVLEDFIEASRILGKVEKLIVFIEPSSIVSTDDD